MNAEDHTNLYLLRFTILVAVLLAIAVRCGWEKHQETLLDQSLVHPSSVYDNRGDEELYRDTIQIDSITIQNR